MSTFSQSIPNFLSGVSQQPDNRKRPGQVKEAVNVYPDFALGMLKRPGSKFISTLFNASTSDNNKWFPILRDSSEKYVAQFDGNNFKIWDLETGFVQLVDHGNTPTCTASVERDLYDTAVDTLIEKYSDLIDAEDAYRLTLNEGIDNIYEVEVEYQYPATGTTADPVTCVTYDGTNYRFYKEGVKNVDGDLLVPFWTSTSSTYVAGTSSTDNNPSNDLDTDDLNYSLGTERTDDHPLLAQGGIKVYELR